MKKSDLWMPLYIGQYLADTQRLTTEGHGAYLLLIFDYWMSGPLPDDDEQLAAVTKMGVREWRRMRPKIEQFFAIGEGLWRHKRVEEEKSGAKDLIEKKSKAGSAGAAKRWQTHAGANGKDVSEAVANSKASGQQIDGPLPLPTHKSKSKTLSGKPDFTPGFIRFWKAWPKSERKQARPKCFEIWTKKALEEQTDTIVTHVEKLARSDSWQSGFDPMPETYLNKQRWDGAELDALAIGEKPWTESWSGIVAKGKSLGIEPRDSEPGPEFKRRVMEAAGVAA